MSSFWTDANGFNTIHRIRSAFGATTIANDIQAVSNAMLTTTWEGVESAPVGVPVAAVNLPGNLIALLTFQCADLTEATIKIPAPQAALFFADGRTVNPANVAVLIADCLANLVSSSGSPAVLYISGTLQPST